MTSFSKLSHRGISPPRQPQVPAHSVQKPKAPTIVKEYLKDMLGRRKEIDQSIPLEEFKEFLDGDGRDPAGMRPKLRWSSLIKYRPNHVSGLTLLWLALIYYNERYEVNQAIQLCHWDNWETWNGEKVNPYRVALIADPQLVDDHTYVGRPKSLMAITRFIVDLYLRKHWVYINKILESDTTLFLGDLFDGGRDWDDKVWFEEYERWKGIFGKSHKDSVMSLPGNHDIGYGDTIHSFALERFQSVFGATSRTLDRGNHTFVLLDTISMENKINQTIYQPHYDFMQELNQQDEPLPRILLTHVPLYRPEGVSCGGKRESQNPFPLTRGEQYQTVLDPDVSSDVLKSIRPIAIFSGDDHDACHVQHSYTKHQAHEQSVADEYTVKSISMAMGISHPGIQLLSLNNPNHLVGVSGETYQTKVCLMAPPYDPFIRYGELAALTLVCLAVVAYAPRWIPRKLRFLFKSSRSVRDLTNSKSAVLPVGEMDHYKPLKKDDDATWRPRTKQSGIKNRVLNSQFLREVSIVGVIAALYFFYLFWTIY